jgi:hypothetical protein
VPHSTRNRNGVRETRKARAPADLAGCTEASPGSGGKRSPSLLNKASPRPPAAPRPASEGTRCDAGSTHVAPGAPTTAPLRPSPAVCGRPRPQRLTHAKPHIKHHAATPREATRKLRQEMRALARSVTARKGSVAAAGGAGWGQRAARDPKLNARPQRGRLRRGLASRRHLPPESCVPGFSSSGHRRLTAHRGPGPGLEEIAGSPPPGQSRNWPRLSGAEGPPTAPGLHFPESLKGSASALAHFRNYISQNAPGPRGLLLSPPLELLLCSCCCHSWLMRKQ